MRHLARARGDVRGDGEDPRVVGVRGAREEVLRLGEPLGRDAGAGQGDGERGPVRAAEQGPADRQRLVGAGGEGEHLDALEGDRDAVSVPRQRRRLLEDGERRRPGARGPVLAGVAQEQGGGAVGVAAAGVQLGHAGEDRPGEVVPVQRAGGVGGEHRALGARQRREHGVLGQRVAPAQPAVRRGDEQAGVDRTTQGAGGRRRVGPGGRRQQVPRQVPTEQGGDAHDVAVGGGEGGDAVGDGVGERLGHLGRQRARRVPAAVAPHDRPRVGEAGRELLDQQR